MMKFECPSCKYVYERDYGTGKKENNYVILGDEQPKCIQMSNNITMSISTEDVFRDEEINLYICPKCKTVKADY